MEGSPSELGVLRPGVVIAAKYQLLAALAEGGMGVVWRAQDLQLSAPVAVKLLQPRHRHDSALRARFQAEAAIGAQLRSPHVVQIFETGVDHTTGLPFIAMELLEGESLQQRLERRGPLAPRELLRVVSQVARALARAHALGVIHRDLKPANIFLVRDGETQLAKVLDFGIAKRVADASGHLRTLTGDLLGTPTYMSPEQLLGSRDVDQRSDLWSLGVIAAECLTGKLPFEAEHLAGLALAICQGRSLLPSTLGAVPPGFDAWFQRATAQSAELRFESALELAEALREVCGGERTMSAPAPEPPSMDDAAGRPMDEVTGPPVEKAAKQPAPSVNAARTVQLARPEQLRRRRTRQALLWTALGGGAFLIFAALKVRLPEPAPPSSAVLRSVPQRAEPPPQVGAPVTPAEPAASAPAEPAVSAPAEPAVSAPGVPAAGSAPIPATASEPPANEARGVEASGSAALAAPLAPQRPRPAPAHAEPAVRSEPEPARSSLPAAAPATRPPPPPDPDNLGF